MANEQDTTMADAIESGEGKLLRSIKSCDAPTDSFLEQFMGYWTQLSDIDKAELLGTAHAKVNRLQRKSKQPSSASNAPSVEQLTNMGQIHVELLKASLRTIEHTDNLISVCGRALREQDCDIDTDVADTIENFAWPQLNEARGAICAVLRAFDAQFVKDFLGNATEAMDRTFAEASRAAVQSVRLQEELAHA